MVPFVCNKPFYVATEDGQPMLCVRTWKSGNAGFCLRSAGTWGFLAQDVDFLT